MNKFKENELYVFLILILIVILQMLLVFACITNKNEIDKLKKDVIILINKEDKK